jgi:hypothetical protein
MKGGIRLKRSVHRSRADDANGEGGGDRERTVSADERAHDDAGEFSTPRAESMPSVRICQRVPSAT